MPKLLLRLVPLLALTVILAGCVRVDLAIHVKDDGSGTLSMLAALDKQLLSLAQQSGTQAANPFDQLSGVDRSQLPVGATVEPYDQDGFVGATVTLPFAAGDDVGKTLTHTLADLEGGAAADLGPATPGAGASDGSGNSFDLFMGLGGTGADGPLQDFVLRRESNGGWRFEATVPSQVSSGDVQGLDTAMLRSLFKDASFTVRLTLPGKVTETNADERSGDELIWNIDPLGDARTLTAVSEPGGGGVNDAVKVVGLVALVALLAGGAGWAAWRRGLPR